MRFHEPVLLAAAFVLLPILASAQSIQLGLFGEGLFTQHKIGGIGRRVTFRAVRSSVIEGEAARYFHSQAFFNGSGRRQYKSGYSVSVGPQCATAAEALSTLCKRQSWNFSFDD